VTTVKRLREEQPPCPRRPWSPLPQVATARQVSSGGEPSGAAEEEETEEEVEVAAEEARHAVEDDAMHRLCSERPRVAAAARASCDTALLEDIFKRRSERAKSRRRRHRCEQ